MLQVHTTCSSPTSWLFRYFLPFLPVFFPPAVSCHPPPRSRQPTAAFSELAFAVPPPAAARPPARSPAGEAWTSRSSNRAVSTTTRGDSERSGICPLALTRRGRADTTATAPPPSSSLSRWRKSAAASAAAAPAEAPAEATRAAPARLEPLDAGSKGRRKGGRRATAAPSGQHKKKPRSSPQRKGLSPAAAAAAAVDPYPAGSAYVATPMTTTESDGGGGAALKGDAVAPRVAAAAPAAARRPRSSSHTPNRRTGGVYTRETARNRRGEGAKKQRYGDVSAKRAKALRTGGKAFLLVCDAESITSPELLESIDILDELGTRDVGVIYADWNKTQVGKGGRGRGVGLGRRERERE